VLALAWLQSGGAAVLVPDQPDFRAFYCAGEAVRAHADPYAVEPGRACQHRLARASGIGLYPDLVVAVALPPYGLVPFALLSLLPFPPAVLLWNLLSYLACGLAAAGLHRLFGTNLALAAVAIVAASIGAFANGQIEPIALALLVGAGLLLRARRDAAAGAIAGLELVKPQLGLAAAASLAVLAPRSRLALAAGAVLLATASVAVAGVAGVARYASVELPAHAASELDAPLAQYSLSTALAWIGVPAGPAQAAGTISYLLIAGAAIAIAARLARSSGDRSFLVFVPCALTLLFGTFVHAYSFALALPLAFGLGALARKIGDRPAGAIATVAAAALVAIALLQALGEPALARPLDRQLAVALARDARPDAPAAVVNADLQRLRTPAGAPGVAALALMKLGAWAALGGLGFAALRLSGGIGRKWESPPQSKIG
jgi:hypothetical protein